MEHGSLVQQRVALPLTKLNRQLVDARSNFIETLNLGIGLVIFGLLQAFFVDAVSKLDGTPSGKGRQDNRRAGQNGYFPTVCARIVHQEPQ